MVPAAWEPWIIVGAVIVAVCLASLYGQVRSLRLYVGEQAQELARQGNRLRRLEPPGAEEPGAERG